MNEIFETSPGPNPVVLDRWGRTPLDPYQNGLFAAACRSWFRVEWEGLEHVPRDGGALLVSNHAGLMPVDGGVIQYGIETQAHRLVYLLAHHGFFRVPFVGRALNRSGTVVANPDNAHRLLREDGHLVLVFPEGEKGPVKPPSERYRLQRFGRGGFVETALRAGVPIVPIVLMGTEDVTPTLTVLELAGQRYPLTLNAVLFGPLLGPLALFPAKIRARVLPPVHFDEPAEQAEYGRSLLMDRAEAIRGDMQTALDEMLAARRSRWLG
ncbi:MAG: acyltransferase family protein [Deltaproteobacteria bacterium]|nr:acyltransferase family protein [Deltaproteobacteria bacterium]